MQAIQTRYTPGPWNVCRTISGLEEVAEYVGENCDGKAKYNSMVENSEYHIAGVGGVGREECLANARLIAAAPALLEALEDLLSELYHWNWTRNSPASVKSRAAIAKAKGQA